MLKNAIALNKHKDRALWRPQHPEYQYLNLVKDIMEEGEMVEGRNGKVKTVIGAAMHFSLTGGSMPLLTTKKTAWKTCLKEMLWFVKGGTSNELLTQQNVHIWDKNTTREFLDSRGLHDYEDGDIGPLYGYSWRHWNAPYEGCRADYTKKGIDQLQQVIDTLKDPAQRSSRRMVISAWNPEQVDSGCLPPCHIIMQFNVVHGNKLSCCMMQRSADIACGIPFNIASYSFLTHLIAHHCGLEPYEFIHYANNCHIYEEHLDTMQEQLKRDPHPFPTLRLLQKRENINDYVVEDFEILDYKHHAALKYSMVA
jgi:thymidylate synthase